jgi:hypothetical protein
VKTGRTQEEIAQNMPAKKKTAKSTAVKKAASTTGPKKAPAKKKLPTRLTHPA